MQRYDYGPSGETLAAEGERPSTLRYTGEQTDTDTGLVYLRARWYDPSTGRFTTRDPFPGLATLPQTLNPYVYVNNNPINLTDPTGKIAPILIAIGIGALIGGIGGGLAYAISNPCENVWQSPGFWQAIGVGAFGGGVAGGVGWVIPALLPTTGFWGSVGVGALSGSAAGGAGQVAVNLLTGAPLLQGVPESMLVGGFTGGIAGGVGWKIRQWIAARTTVHWPTTPHGTPEHWDTIRRQVERMSASGKYSDMFVNKSINTATGGQAQSALRPDIIAKTATERFFIVEVVSPSQTLAQMQIKMRNMAQALGALFGGGKIIQP